MLEHLKTAVILALAGVVIFLWSRPAGMPDTDGSAAVVIVARRDLQPGTVITEDMLEVRTIPRVYMQQDAFMLGSMVDLKLAVGLATIVRIPKGDQLTRNCLKDTGKKPLLKLKVTDKKSLSQEHYVEGLKYFQNANYEKARAEWQQAVKLDPKNNDAVSGLDRIKKITSK